MEDRDLTEPPWFNAESSAALAARLKACSSIATSKAREHHRHRWRAGRH
jgi:hypothetical protein